MPVEAFYPTIVVSMVVLTIVAFIGLYRANQAPNKDPLSLQATGGVLVAALMVGVVGGGILGLLIWVISQSLGK
jgi:hypothetical protein